MDFVGDWHGGTLTAIAKKVATGSARAARLMAAKDIRNDFLSGVIHMRFFATSLALGALALSATTVVTVADADARERRVSGQVQTQRGTAHVERNTTRAKGERSRSTTVTGPSGATRSSSESRTRDREAGTYSRDRDRTYADGTSRSVDVDAQRTGEGTYSASRTVTGRDGETRTQTGDFNRTRTENGATTTGTIQTQNHGAIDYNRETTRGDGARSVSATSSFEDGTTRQRDASVSRDAQTGVVTATGAVTNRQGETRSTSAVRAPTENGSTDSRDTTFADGTTRAIDRTTTRDGEGGASVDRTVTGSDSLPVCTVRPDGDVGPSFFPRAARHSRSRKRGGPPP
jgi:hypothetical protein